MLSAFSGIWRLDLDVIRRENNILSAPDCGGHDWWHVNRVANTAKKLAACGADLFVVELAALLHDIGDYKLSGPSDEPESVIARCWLEKQPLDKETIEHICQIIEKNVI